MGVGGVVGGEGGSLEGGGGVRRKEGRWGGRREGKGRRPSMAHTFARGK